MTVLGHSGYLGSIVERRWTESGWDGDYVVCTFDDVGLIRRLATSGGVIVPSTDAIIEDTDYAARKREIEGIAGTTVIRAGIVDIRKTNGYCHWECNPLTPLEWADLAWEKRDQVGVYMAGREPLTRYAVGCAVAEVFGVPKPRKRCGQYLNRIQPKDRERPDILTALREFRDWLG